MGSKLAASLAVAALVLGSVVVAAGAPASAAVETQLSISPTGTGTSCTTSAPCSIAQAQSAVRAAAPTMAGDIEVVVGAGTYTLTSPLTFTSADSGTNGHSVRWIAASGARPLFSGAYAVTGWTQSATNPNLWQADVPSGTNFRQLYVNNERRPRARSGYNPAGFTATSTGYTTTASASLAAFANPSAIEMSYRQLWSWGRCAVGSVSGTTVTMSQPCWENRRKNPYLNSPSILSIENAYELLDSPGEWYLDTTGVIAGSTPRLYYYPRPGESLTGSAAVTVTHPTIDRLLDISGASTGARVHDLQIVGLSFADANWLRPATAEGFHEIQANFTNTGTNQSHYTYDTYTKTPGAVRIAYANDILLQGGTFSRFGAVGIEVEKGSHNITLVGNEVTDVSGNGIQIGDIQDHHPANPDTRTRDITVQNTYVHNVANEFMGGVGIWAGFIDGLTAQHNEIADVPYSGVSVGWGWGYLDEGGRGSGTASGPPPDTVAVTTPTMAGGNRIENNYIHDYMMGGNDGGAVYTLGSQPGSTEKNNYFAEAPSNTFVAGIYFDNGTQGYTASGNVIDRVQQWVLANDTTDSLGVPAAKNNTISGNWSNTSTKICCTSGRNNAFTGNVETVSGQAWPAAAQTVIDNAGLQTSAVDALGVTHDWKSELRGAMATNLLAMPGVVTTASSSYDSGSGGEKATDGSGQSRWAAASTDATPILTVTFPSKVDVTSTVIREAKVILPTVQRYRVDYWSGTAWVPTAENSFPGLVQTDRFAAVTTNSIRFVFTGPGASILEVEVYGAPTTATTTNVALGKPTTASNVYQGSATYVATKATDGDAGTRWATDDTVTTATLEVDLGGTTLVSSTVLRENTTYGQRITGYAIEYWSGSAWIAAATRTTRPTASQRDDFTPVTTTRIRLRITGVSPAMGPTVDEFEVYGEPAATNVALGRTTTASNVYQGSATFAANKATDGDAGTRWATDDAAGTATLEVDLGTSRTVSSTTLRENTTYGQRITGYVIEYWSGSTWVAAKTVSSRPAAAQSDVFAPATTTKVRLRITGVSPALGPTIDEFEVYG
ncbi:MAG: discoidin domain-containing protein [Rhodoglobus sp.]